VLAIDQASDGFPGEVVNAVHPAERSDNRRELCFSADSVARTFKLDAFAVVVGRFTATPV
jgi:hypothetical protein